MPSTVTLATSAPRPPVGPPPAVVAGALLLTGDFDATAFGVATFGGFFALVFRSLSAFIREGSGVSRAIGAGAAFSAAAFCGAAVGSVFGVGCTSPIARGPGGAATRFTRYVGGIGTGGAPRARKNTETARMCNSVDTATAPRRVNPRGDPRAVTAAAPAP